MAMDEYIYRYQNEDYAKFLRTLFQGDYIIIFVGYSLSELEIIDFIVEKYKLTESLLSNLYVLHAIFKNERPLIKYEEKYFTKLGINVVPYEIDKIGYEQLDVVFDAWTEYLLDPKNKDEFNDNARLIDKYL